jgi:uncharacterized glyoxalase superfamily protein PhnB
MVAKRGVRLAEGPVRGVVADHSGVDVRDDARSRYRTFQRAVDAGATTMEAPLDTPSGEGRAMVRDPWGNVFQIAHQRLA